MGDATRFCERHAGLFSFETYENRLPHEDIPVLVLSGRMLIATEAMGCLCGRHLGTDAEPYATEPCRRLAARFKPTMRPGRDGFKLRTGGLEASAFPRPKPSPSSSTSAATPVCR